MIKDVKDYQGPYKVTSTGKIFSCKLQKYCITLLLFCQECCNIFYLCYYYITHKRRNHTPRVPIILTIPPSVGKEHMMSEINEASQTGRSHQLKLGPTRGI